MVFSSISFIYYFLPITLLVYFITPSKFKNIILLICSILFYFYSENIYLIILLLSCIINYLGGLLISKFQNTKKAKIILIITLIIDIGLLSYFKYTNFFINTFNDIFKANISPLYIIMPLGISFFTFQTISYIIDVYQQNILPSKNFINFACYVCLFPQLVAGPIVRYKDIDKELKNRKSNFDDFGSGCEKFIIGLSKKVLIANTIGEMISSFQSLSNPSVLSYIFIAIGYSLQIYFDFSGYSDMAIGLGRMFGFHFLENFNYPFIAKSITDFWRRWHISLSSFFKDYVYIPLGGNRVSTIKHIRNIVIVWLLTGFWHGADWNFIIWGLYFGILLIIEKYFLYKYLDKHPVIGHIYSLFLIIISFVIFNCSNLNTMIDFLKNMLGLSHLSFVNYETIYYVKSYFIIFLIAIICSTPIVRTIYIKLKNQKKFSIIISIFEIITCLILLIISTAYLIDSSFNPFLYFRF